ncbi:hypothetical protein CDD82_1167 [Ophiocordyceps australis]|uniref:Ubiquitin carboxyl-terminal hydrolase n=1 Tax=Ophiocordyceps australis TaxID=1399860 RepID=A0A2C5ZJP9_9HYPO|nr:hypothetical protein CDD82_1167 [Ophiocordyceps australis]
MAASRPPSPHPSCSSALTAMARKSRLSQAAHVSAASDAPHLSDDALDHIAQHLAASFSDKIVHDIVDRVAAKLADEIGPTIVAKLDQALSHVVDQRSAKQCTCSAQATTPRQAPSASNALDPQDLPVSPLPSTLDSINKVEPCRKRKRTTPDDNNATTDNVLDLPNDALLEALKPLTASHVEEWDGWVEVESEPAFFNSILQRLGVGQAVIKELLSLEDWALAMLPQPVLGLIFLFQYAPHLDHQDHDGEHEQGASIWFANQTTNNSCASVALLNIVMNTDQVQLGPELQAFKQSTQHLSSPMRGHTIGANMFIRTAHNSFARRMDQLNADLCLASEVEENRRAQARKRSGPRKPRRKEPDVAGGSSNQVHEEQRKRHREPDVDYAYHFIAYVPARGAVWELDGMRIKPRRIGPLDSNDWTSIAGPRIQERIREYGDQENNFSLLALCRCPLLALRDTIASNLATMRLLRSQMQADESFNNLVAAEELSVQLDSPAQLDEFGLDPARVDAAHTAPSDRARLAQPTFDTEQAFAWYKSLDAATRAAMSKYRDEFLAETVQEDRVRSRQQDYTPALHCWLTKLAEKGFLEDVIKKSRP